MARPSSDVSAHPLRNFAVFTSLVGAASVVVFLFACGWFSAWDGQLVVHGAAPQGQWTKGLVVAKDGSEHVVRLPPRLAEDYDLPLSEALRAPVPLPETAPAATKSRFSIHFSVGPADHRTEVPTTSPGAVGAALALFLVAVGLRNSSVSGAPWDPIPRERPVSAPMVPPAEAGAPVPRGPRPKKGPPPPKPSSRPR